MGFHLEQPLLCSTLIADSLLWLTLTRLSQTPLEVEFMVLWPNEYFFYL